LSGVPNVLTPMLKLDSVKFGSIKSIINSDIRESFYTWGSSLFISIQL